MEPIKAVRIWARFSPKSKPFFEYINKIVPNNTAPIGIRLGHAYLPQFNPENPSTKSRIVKSLHHIAERNVPYKQEFYPPNAGRSSILAVTKPPRHEDGAVRNLTLSLSNNITWFHRHQSIITTADKVDVRSKRLNVALAKGIDQETAENSVGALQTEIPAVEIDGFLVSEGIDTELEFIPFATPETVIEKTEEEIAARNERRANSPRAGGNRARV